MKKIAVILLATLLCGTAVACSSNESTDTSSSDVSVAESVEDSSTTQTIVDGPVDTSFYRGVVTAMEPLDDNSIVLTLQEYVGTDYGAAQAHVILDDNTKMSSDLSPEETLTVDSFEVGDYVQVYFTGHMEAAIDEAGTAIIAFNLGEADARVTNGVVQAIVLPTEENTEGSITVETITDGEIIVVNYSLDGSTETFVNINDLKEGDEISVFHAPVMAASEPPQIFATEIATYSNPDQTQASSTTQTSEASESTNTAEEASSTSSN